MINWFRLAVDIAIGGGALYGIYWAYKNDYIQWSTVKESFSLDGFKDTLATIISDPTFIFLYLIFVIAPVWILTSYLHYYDIPMYQKIIMTFGGIWGVDQVMKAKGLR